MSTHFENIIQIKESHSYMNLGVCRRSCHCSRSKGLCLKMASTINLRKTYLQGGKSRFS